MNFQKRKQAILRKLEEAGEADIKGLASEMKVAEITVRRDLNLLAADGKFVMPTSADLEVSATEVARSVTEPGLGTLAGAV